MRRRFSALAVAACAGALALGGCGGDDEAASPLDAALGYLPKDVPFAVAIETDLDGEQYKALDRIVRKFPFSEQLTQLLEEEVEENGTDFQKDIRPLLGNPLVVGGTSASSITDDADEDEFVLALQVKDTEKLDALLQKEKAKEQGERAGATIYRDDQGDYLAVEEDVLVVASTRRQLDRALDQRDKDDRFTEDDFGRGLEGLPNDALMKVYADVEALIKSDPDSGDAQRIEWIKALRTFGLTAVAKDDLIDVDFNLTTEGDLSEEDLPIASGDESPGVLRRRGEIGFGIRNLAQNVKFSEAAAQAVDPSGYGEYAAAKRQIDQQLGVSVDDDLIGQLTGDMAMSVAVDGKLGLRSELKDPAAFERTLRRVADVLPEILESTGAGDVALAKPKRGGDFYALAEADGDSYVFGVVDDVFVLANDAARAGKLAGESPSPVPGAKGAIAMSADAQQLATQVLSQSGVDESFGGMLGSGLFTAPLDQLNGSLSASPDGMRGSFELSLD